MIESKEVDGSVAEWNEQYPIGLKVKDLPRMAKLCITLYCQNARKMPKSNSSSNIDKKKKAKVSFLITLLFVFAFVWSLLEDRFSLSGTFTLVW